ncbi:MAG: hypothetical protein L0Y58_00065 [Verrucomicrobia subdivision 3 bacterium]|nr:hypothetical protein [Limisphaerales bacterium]
MNKQLFLKAVLIMISLYHCFLGLAPFLSDALTVQLARSVFGLKLEMTNQMGYIVKLLGVYAMVFGLVCAVVAFNTEKYRALLNIVFFLYLFRVLNKLAFMGKFTQAFDASPSRVWSDIVLLAFFGLAVLLLKPRSPVPTPKAA